MKVVRTAKLPMSARPASSKRARARSVARPRERRPGLTTDLGLLLPALATAEPQRLLQLQRLVGNDTVRRLIDRAADGTLPRSVLRGGRLSPGMLARLAHAGPAPSAGAPRIARLCGACAEEEQRRAGATGTTSSRTPDHDGARTLQRLPAAGNGSGGVPRLIQRTPAPGRDFGTYRYCSFGITTPIPGFIKGLVTDDFDVDYTTGCGFVAGNAWDSVWELYDASNRKVDSNGETPFGDYSIPADDLNAGVPSDGSSSKWSLWYRITRSNPWHSDDNDAYPYDVKEFDVYSDPIKDPRTTLKEEEGPVAWATDFTPAEDGASLDYSVSTTATRSVDQSQTTSVSATVGGSRDAQVGFSFDGLTGGFSRSLNWSATASISRTHSVNVSTVKNETFNFHQGSLRGGVTYHITARPVYYLIDGSVQMISHRDGVISTGSNRVEGGIRVLKKMAIRFDADDKATIAAGRWSCKASCNVEGTADHCQNKRVTGSSSRQPNEATACREAKRDATQKAPADCYARHCRCYDCTDR